MSLRLGIQGVPSPRSQSPRPSTSRDPSDKKDDRRRSRDSSDQKEDKRKPRIPNRNSSPSSLVINKRTPKEKSGEDSTPEKETKQEKPKENPDKGEKEKPKVRKPSSSSKSMAPKDDKKRDIWELARQGIEKTRQTLKKNEEKQERLKKEPQRFLLSLPRKKTLTWNSTAR